MLARRMPRPGCATVQRVWGRLAVGALLLSAVGAPTVAAGGDPVTRHAPRVVYSLGASFEGLPLTWRSADGTTFAYGTCDASRGGCAPPLQLQNWDLRRRHPAKFSVAPGEPPSCLRMTLRGVPAAVFATSGGGLEVYAGQTVVVIFGNDSRQIRRAAFALRAVNGPSYVRPRLPSPPRDVARALARCGLQSTERKLTELRRSARRTLYWVGRSFAGHPLSWVEGAGHVARFVYGACAMNASHFQEGACWPPFEIETHPLARRSPSRYAHPAECRRATIRGVPAAVIARARTLQLFTGTTTVTVQGRNIRLARRAAQAIRPLATRHPSRRMLPQPPRRLRLELARHCRGG